MNKTKQVRRFHGLNNVTDPLRLGLKWLSRADNIDVTDDGGLRRRDGFESSLPGALSGAYATQDGSRMYIVDAGELKEVFADMSTETLKTGLAAVPMQWAEIGDQVYFTDGVSDGVIHRDGRVETWSWPTPGQPTLHALDGKLAAGLYRVAFTFLLPDGRETGAGLDAQITLGAGQSLQITDIPQVVGLRTQVYIAPADSTVFALAFEARGTAATWNEGPDALGMELMTQFMDPLPPGADTLAVWQGRAYLGRYDAASNTSVVWASEPLGFHLFNLSKSFFAVPGRVTLLAAHDTALIVGTDSHIYSYDGEKLTTLAPYGAVPGWSATLDEDDGKVLFWTTRGLCSALPFVNLTSRQISVAPGVQAGAAIVREGGAKRYVVSLVKGGTAYNPRT